MNVPGALDHMAVLRDPGHQMEPVSIVTHTFRLPFLCAVVCFLSIGNAGARRRPAKPRQPQPRHKRQRRPLHRPRHRLFRRGRSRLPPPMKIGLSAARRSPARRCRRPARWFSSHRSKGRTASRRSPSAVRWRRDRIHIAIQVPISVWLPTGVKLVSGENDEGILATFKWCARRPALVSPTSPRTSSANGATPAKAAEVPSRGHSNQRDVALPVSWKGFRAHVDALAKE